MFNSSKLCFLLLFTVIYNAFSDDIPVSLSPNFTLPSTDSKQQKSRMRKTKNEKKQKKASSYREMSYEELRIAKDEYSTQKNYTTAIKYLEHMIKLCTDAHAIGEHLLEIADLLVMDGQHSRAAQKYAEYVTLYPGGQKFEYALFKAIECSFECTLTYDRDQTKTEETLALAESFLKQDHLVTYIDQVVVIRDNCYAKLAESELNICSFYLQRGDLKPAEKRLDTIRSQWLPKAPAIETTLCALEADLVVQKEAVEQKNIKMAQLPANKTTRQKHMADRF